MGKNILILTILILLPFTLAWDDCSLNCNTPSCGAYMDTNNNNLCDHGEPTPTPSTAQFISLSIPVAINEYDIITKEELKNHTIREIANLYQIDENIYATQLSQYYHYEINPKDHFQTLHDTINIEPSTAKEIALNIKTKAPITEQSTTGKKYRLITFSLIPIFGYLLTLFLSRKKIISIQNHRKIWNIILTGSFLISGIFGIILVIIANGAPFNIFFNILKWHVEAGIILAWTSIFHALWHIPYFKKIFNFK